MYDKQVGIENSVLFRGIEYVELHRVINEFHKFFEVNEFVDASIIYNDQKFPNVPIKYNVYDDLILVNLQYNQNKSIFKLINNRVQEFYINGHQFIYLETSNDIDLNGFFEVIDREGAFKIYKRHKKDMQERRDKQMVYHEFKNDKPDYYFEFQNDVFELRNKRNLFDVFPKLKSEIRNFYRANRKEFRNNPEDFMKTLATEMNSLLSNFQNEI
ncbi:hypothetical protein [Salegentibacter sp. UBA1130]|uniref:hypothetical protein n=1 Tax=Salegentibacter sp. UBA1130 TaxID=1947451 RepID=UPI00257C836E|nr:hypothetical protein [Salegentibacter sp. UBA1130]